MAEGTKNKVSISDRDKKVLYIVGGLIILALAYFFGFQKMMESKKALVEENLTLSDEVHKLTQMVSDKASVEQATQTFREETEEIVAHYPPEVRTQDAIYQMDQLEQGVKNLVLQAESFTMNQVFFANGALTEGEVQDVAATPATGGDAASAGESAQGPVTGYRSTIMTNCMTNYDSLKKIVDFVNNNPSRMSISSITVTQGEGTKELACNMSLDMYAVSGTGKEYNPPSVDQVQIGKGEKLFAEGKGK